MNNQKKTRRIFALLTAVLAAVCMLYCVCIFLFISFGTRFFLVWGVMGAGIAVWSFLLWNGKLSDRIPKRVRRFFAVCAIAGLILFGVVEGLVLSGMKTDAPANVDYVIVLGAQWKTSGPSYTLQKRLDAAARYLKDNPDTRVIVSGGKGADEPISEAEGMAEYLRRAGIEDTRIFCEDASTNTDENLKFSSVFLDKEKNSVALVTSNYHVFRAKKLAKKQGYAHVSGIAADSYPAMVPNNLLREFFAVIKDFLVGNL